MRAKWWQMIQEVAIWAGLVQGRQSAKTTGRRPEINPRTNPRGPAKWAAAVHFDAAGSQPADHAVCVRRPHKSKSNNVEVAVHVRADVAGPDRVNQQHPAVVVHGHPGELLDHLVRCRAA